MSKYEIIRGKEFGQVAYSGRHVELKRTLDRMKDGDCIFVETLQEKEAAYGHAISAKFKGHKVSTRLDRETGGFFIWKLKDDDLHD